MVLDEAVVIFNLNLNERIRKNIISFIDYKAIVPMPIGGENLEGEIDKNSRKVNGYTLETTSASDKIYFRHIANIIFSYLPNYNIKFFSNQAGRINQIDLLKYNTSNKYEMHTDSHITSFRTISCILNLNNEYEGGDLVFFNPINKQEIKRIKCKTGTLVFFPSNFLFPHTIEPITKGTRYSLASWII